MLELLGRLLALAALEPTVETRLLSLLADGTPPVAVGAATVAASSSSSSSSSPPVNGAALLAALSEPICMHFATHFPRFASALVAQPNRTILVDALVGIVDFLIGRRKYLHERYRSLPPPCLGPERGWVCPWRGRPTGMHGPPPASVLRAPRVKFLVDITASDAMASAIARHAPPAQQLALWTRLLRLDAKLRTRASPAFVQVGGPRTRRRAFPLCPSSRRCLSPR